MITLITGLPGHGKTYFVVGHLIDRLNADGARMVYQDGIPELTKGWHPTDGAKWPSLPENSIIVIDEAQRIFRPASSGAAIPDYISGLETHRHKGLDIVLMTQDARMLHANVRRLAGEHYHLHRPMQQSWANVYRWDGVREEVNDSAKSLAQVERIMFSKDVYAQYKSATAHHVKARWPWQLFAVPGLIVLIISLVWYALRSPQKAVEDITGKKKGTSASQIAEAAKQGGDVNVAPGIKLPPPPFDPDTLTEKRLRLLEQRLALVQDEPHTAERYAALTRPKVVPAIRACAATLHGAQGWRCTCFLPNGSPLPVSEDACWRHIREGSWYDWDAPMGTRQSIGDRETSAVVPPGDLAAPSSPPLPVSPPSLPAPSRAFKSLPVDVSSPAS
jgi:zona occludens toxin